MNSESPLSFLEWNRINRNSITVDRMILAYQNYLTEFYKNNVDALQTFNDNLKQEFIGFIKNLDIKNNNFDRSNFIKNLDFSNESDAATCIPFLATKLKELCINIRNIRKEIPIQKIKHNLQDTELLLKIEIEKYIKEKFGVSDINIDISKNYDYNNYFEPSSTTLNTSSDFSSSGLGKYVIPYSVYLYPDEYDILIDLISYPEPTEEEYVNSLLSLSKTMMGNELIIQNKNSEILNIQPESPWKSLTNSFNPYVKYDYVINDNIVNEKNINAFSNYGITRINALSPQEYKSFITIGSAQNNDFYVALDPSIYNSYDFITNVDYNLYEHVIEHDVFLQSHSNNTVNGTMVEGHEQYLQNFIPYKSKNFNLNHKTDINSKLIKSRFDIYNNRFNLYKDITSGNEAESSIYHKNYNLLGEVIIESFNNKQIPLNIFFNSVFEKYISYDFYNDLMSNNILDFDILGDVLYLKLDGYIIIEKYDIDDLGYPTSIDYVILEEGSDNWFSVPEIIGRSLFLFELVYDISYSSGFYIQIHEVDLQSGKYSLRFPQSHNTLSHIFGFTLKTKEGNDIKNVVSNRLDFPVVKIINLDSFDNIIAFLGKDSNKNIFIYSMNFSLKNGTFNITGIKCFQYRQHEANSSPSV